MTETLEIRRVDEGSWRTYRDVRLAMLLDTPRAFGSTYAREAAFSESIWLDRVRGEARTWLAGRGNLPLGSVTVVRFEEQAPDEARLVAMWVAGHARGCGVGQALVETVLADARERGLRMVTLDVADENAAARRLYERMGFRPTGRTSTLAHNPDVPEIEMALELASTW
jgi:ribosomal protein S18 acetylase RimI-like enzyme